MLWVLQLMARKVPTFAPGDRVRLTGSFLRSTGQYAGGDGPTRWTVLAVQTLKHSNSVLVLTDELRADDGMFTPEELAADPTLKYRRILACNLEKVRT
jgi:hypothetical protein